MDEDRLFEIIKTSLEKIGKDEIIEFTAALTERLLSNGVMCSFAYVPDYIDYVDDNGLIQRVTARYDINLIRDTLTVNFSEHDEKVRDELRREILKAIPEPPKI